MPILPALLLAALAAPLAAEEPPFNVVVLVADDLGWTGLGCYGSDLYETPHLDGLAADGVRFTAAYSASPVCSPSRAALHTGLHPARVRVTDVVPGRSRPWERMRPPNVPGRLRPGFPTLARVLTRAGWRTGHFGKWHLDPPVRSPSAGPVTLPGFGVHWDRPYGQKGYWLREEGERRYLTDALIDHAIAFVDEDSDRPFYLHVDFHAPHTPIEGRPELVERFAAKVRPDGLHTDPEYAAMVAALDESVGRLLAHLDERGLSERTLVVFASDNGGHSELGGEPTGYTSNAPLRGSKGSAYEGGVRVPMIVRWPGVSVAGGVCDDPTIGMDVFPTALEAAGVEFRPEQGEELDGASLAPLLADPSATLDRDLYWHYPHYRQQSSESPFGAIRSGDLRLVEFFEDGRTELYDLAADPGERHDLAAERPDEARALKKRLAAWRRSVGAQMPKPNPNHQEHRALEEVGGRVRR